MPDARLARAVPAATTLPKMGLQLPPDAAARLAALALPTEALLESQTLSSRTAVDKKEAGMN
jgi:hypothetical protein